MENWLLAWIGGITTIMGALVAAWKSYQKVKADEKAEQSKLDKEKAEISSLISKQETERLDYLFQQYRITVELVRKEHEEDRVMLSALQAEHTKSRDEHAQCREEMAVLKLELSQVRKQLVELQTPKS